MYSSEIYQEKSRYKPTTILSLDLFTVNLQDALSKALYQPPLRISQPSPRPSTVYAILGLLKVYPKSSKAFQTDSGLLLIEIVDDSIFIILFAGRSFFFFLIWDASRNKIKNLLKANGETLGEKKVLI